jgi:hypothetical protein
MGDCRDTVFRSHPIRIHLGVKGERRLSTPALESEPSRVLQEQLVELRVHEYICDCMFLAFGSMSKSGY